MEAVFGIEKPKPVPVLPPSPPPPTLDAAAERQVTGDRIKVRKGRAATDLGGAAPSPSTRVGVFKALGGV